MQVEKSKNFRREGADVHSDVAVSLAQAVLGGTIRLPGIYDDILLKVSTYWKSIFNKFLCIFFAILSFYILCICIYI